MRAFSIVLLGVGFLILLMAFQDEFLFRAATAGLVFLGSAWCWDRANKREAAQAAMIREETR